MWGGGAALLNPADSVIDAHFNGPTHFNGAHFNDVSSNDNFLNPQPPANCDLTTAAWIGLMGVRERDEKCV